MNDDNAYTMFVPDSVTLSSSKHSQTAESDKRLALTNVTGQCLITVVADAFKEIPVLQTDSLSASLLRRFALTVVDVLRKRATREEVMLTYRTGA